MTDQEYILRLFETDCREKKRNARGEHNRVKSNRGKMKTASDYMTAKERKALNGEMVTINMNKPVNWKELQTWSQQSQKEYIENLRKTYDVPFTKIAAMLGVRLDEFTEWRKQLGIFGERGSKKWDRVGWKAFCGNKEELLNPVIKVEKEEITEYSPDSQQGSDILSAVLKAIMNTAKGAKITIEIEV